MKKHKFKTIKNFLELVKPYKRSGLVLFALIVLLEVLKLSSPYILKLIIDGLLVFSSEKISYFIVLIIIFFLLLLIVELLGYLKDKRAFSVLINAEYSLPVKCQRKLLDLDLVYHQEEGTGDKITKIERGVFKFTELLGTLFWELLPVAFQFLLTSVALLLVDYRLFLLLLLFSSILIIINYRVNGNVYPLRKKRYKEYEEASGKMVQSIININTVQSFSQQKRENREFRSLKESILLKSTKEWFYILKFASLREVVVGLGRVSFLLFGIFMVTRNQMSVGTLVFVITLSEKVFSSLSRAYRLYDRFAEGSEGINRLSDLLKTKSNIKNKGKIKPNKIEGKIVFKDVNFYYNKSEKVLDNLNLHIPSGLVTALVGPSGGGKTTIIRLIFRHFDIMSGSIMIDKYNLKDLELFNFRKFLSIVPQEVDIFNLSVFDNIAYSRASASLEEVEEAAKIANASEFIEQLPEGYNTIVGERGVKLSGGQRQRIGIARAILANPKILIFDEATSNLDSESERLIQDAIFRVAKNKTVIIIAHRLSTIKMADKIVVVENGRVVEEGMHLQLLGKKNGLYRRLINLQDLGELSKD